MIERGFFPLYEVIKNGDAIVLRIKKDRLQHEKFISEDAFFT